MKRGTIIFQYSVLIMSIILVWSCGKPKPQQEMVGPPSKVSPIKDSVSTTQPVFITLPNLEDSSIFKALYGKDEVMIIDMNYGTDTAYLSIDSRFQFKEGNTEYAMVRLFASSGTMHGHDMYREDIGIFQKTDSCWILTDTVIDGFAFDMIEEPSMSQLGTYTLFEFWNEGAYSGGNYEKGVAYMVVRNGKIIGDAGYSEFVETNNSGSEFCSVPEENDPGFECRCEETKGDLKVKYDPVLDALVYTYLGKLTTTSGNKCQYKTTCFETRIYMANQQKGELVLETKNCGGKRDTLKYVPPEKRLK
jgi:hypothetical protein